MPITSRARAPLEPAAVCGPQPPLVARMAIECVVVQHHLRIGGNEVPAGGDDQRVDLDQLGILRQQRPVEPLGHRAHRRSQMVLQAERANQRRQHERPQAEQRIDRLARDLRGGHRFDLDAAFGTRK
jgi:hypothetical protein